MSEDRTQAPSKHRKEQARERGQVAQSTELTGAVGLLFAAGAVAIWGDGLALALLSRMEDSVLGPVPVSAEAAEVVGRLRALAFGLVGPLFPVLLAFGVGALAAHQAQVRGLWAPGLLAPDAGRLWGPGVGPGLAARAGRGVWALGKTVVVVAVASWVVRADFARFAAFGGLDAPGLARASAGALRHLLLVLAGATLLLGLIDFGVQHVRFASMLGMTPDEQREELRSVEGDPALRARRRRMARSWRADPGEMLVGSSLILKGASGLTVVLAGGPPPRFVSVRTIVSGEDGETLRKAAETRKMRIVDAPGLARRFASRRPPSLPPSAELLEELGPHWCGRAEAS